MDGANVPMVVVDPSGMVTRWNLKAAEVFGCPSESALRPEMIYLRSNIYILLYKDSYIYIISRADSVDTSRNLMEKGKFKRDHRMFHRILKSLSTSGCYILECCLSGHPLSFIFELMINIGHRLSFVQGEFMLVYCS